MPPLPQQSPGLWPPLPPDCLAHWKEVPLILLGRGERGKEEEEGERGKEEGRGGGSERKKEEGSLMLAILTQQAHQKPEIYNHTLNNCCFNHFHEFNSFSC